MFALNVSGEINAGFGIGCAVMRKIYIGNNSEHHLFVLLIKIPCFFIGRTQKYLRAGAHPEELVG